MSKRSFEADVASIDAEFPLDMRYPAVCQQMRRRSKSNDTTAAGQ